MNWKTKAAASIVNHGPAAGAVAPQAGLYEQVSELIKAGKIPARDLYFVQSVMKGYVRYGSFTEKQEAALRRAIEPKTPPNDGDLILAEKLQKAVNTYLIGSDYNFGTSLLEGFARYGSFTERQRPHVERLAASCVDEEASHQYPEQQVVPAAPVAAPKADLFPNLCAIVNLDKFARFEIGDLRLSLKNDGSVIWCKFGVTLFGLIDSSSKAFRKLQRGLSSAEHDQAFAQLLDVETDPVAHAKQSGILTGRCSCCGRALTDPVSIEIGIGPVCLGKLG